MEASFCYRQVSRRPRLRATSLLCFAALVAGCGRSGSTPTSSGTGEAPPPPAPPASKVPLASAKAAAPGPNEADVFVLAKEPARAKGIAGARSIGCDDVLLPRHVSVAGAAPKERLRETLQKLLGTMTESEIGADAVNPVASSKMALAKISEKDGTFFVELAGTPSFGGICAVPRFKRAIELTAAAHGNVVLALNGSASAWKCLGDESGLCK